MEYLKAKYRTQLEKIIASKDPSETDVLNSSIAELRFINEKLIQNRDNLRDTARATQMRHALDKVAEEMRANEARHKSAARSRISNNLGTNQFTMGTLAGLTTGAILAVVSLSILQVAGIVDVAFGPDARRRVALDEQFLSDHQVIPVADAYLNKAVAAVVEMQKKSPEKLKQIAGKNFISLHKIDPKLGAEKPKALPKYSDVIVKVDQEGYKVLLNWPLCSAAKWSKPQLVDPVRKSDGNRCSHFGYWNEAGAKF
ncbi:hypothetical protein [Brucella tritici]|uniref:Uncharacterized protein n=1 Tax=Brucella tritici TaxID=94626 RepID=A0A6L3Y3A1_9HYPH|nr:hypothetical protein [Brucella tritici]KAB2673913.1 hypothetical protein F9L08_28995 [Brucella tritici]